MEFSIRVWRGFGAHTMAISHHDGQWFRPPLNTRGVTEYDQLVTGDEFIDLLAQAGQCNRFPQMLFGRTEDIDLFLQIEDPRLDSLQEYVRFARRTKNTLVVSAEEIAALTGVNMPDLAKPTWVNQILESEFLADRVHPPVLAIMHPRISTLLPLNCKARLEPDDHLYSLCEHLRMSDTIISHLTEPDSSAGIRVGTQPDGTMFIAEPIDDELINEAHRMFFVPDRKYGPSLLWIMRHANDIPDNLEPGRIIPVRIAMEDRTSSRYFFSRPMEVPVDLHLANLEGAPT